jgi:prepilin-type N-terminal cleavage/methylation domain-containing protein/prepilin-type processing-associated H-X9-DG protein
MKKKGLPSGPRCSWAPNSRAFTLIELLVVIAIVAVLAGLLFPVFARAKAAAQKSTCISNFHQISTASLLYASDFADTYCPPFCGPPPLDPINDPMTWDRLLFPYMKSTKVIACPSDDFSPVVHTLDYGDVRRSYTMPGDLGWVWTEDGQYGNVFGVNASQVAFPSISIQFYERDNNNPQDGKYEWCAVGDASSEIVARHNGSSNVAYLDGHVKSKGAAKGTTASGPLFEGYRCYPMVRAGDSTPTSSYWGTPTYGTLPLHDGLDVTCGGTEGTWPLQGPS